MLPKDCKMPDVQGIEPLMPSWMAHRLGVGDKGVDRFFARYRIHYVRLADKALMDYLDAWNRLRLLVESSNAGLVMTYFFAHINSLENCINSVVRAFKLLERIRRGRHGPAIPRQIYRQLEAHRKQLPDIRNILEHIDEEIQEERIADDEPLTLVPGSDGDRAQISDKVLLYTDLATVIQVLNQIGHTLIGYRPTIPSNPA